MFGRLMVSEVGKCVSTFRPCVQLATCPAYHTPPGMSQTGGFGSIGGFEGCKRVFLVVKVQKLNLNFSLNFLRVL
nr:MAG TPA: hypothetical protein [Caudoviricetes sp.]